MTEIADPRFALTFLHPSISSTGEAIERIDEEREGMTTIRLAAGSPERRSTYFEVSRFADTDDDKLYEGLVAAPGELIVGPREATQLAGQPAWTFTLQRGSLHRTVFLVQRGADLYRVTFDPALPTNLQILATLRFWK